MPTSQETEVWTKMLIYSFPVKAVLFQGYSDLPTRALPFLVLICGKARLQRTVAQCGARERRWKIISMSVGLKLHIQCIILTVAKEVLLVTKAPQPVTVGAPLPDCVFPEMGFLKKSFSLFFTVLCLCCSVGFSLAAVSRGCSSLRCTGFSLQWRLFLRSTGFRCAGFSSWSTWVQEVWFLGSGAPGQQLWYTGLVVPQPVKSSCNRDQIHVPCIGR